MTQAYGEAWYWDKRYANDAGPFEWYQNYDALSPILHHYIPSQSHPRILVVGCGNSAFSEGMINDGYGDVINIDISSVVIGAMQKKYSNYPQLKYLQEEMYTSVVICYSEEWVYSLWKLTMWFESTLSTLEKDIIDLLAETGNLPCDEPMIPNTHLTGENYSQSEDIEMDVRDMSAFQTGSLDAVVDKGTLDSLLCGHNSRQNAARMLEEVGRVLKNEGVYILITYGAPIYRLRFLRDSCSWTIKLHVIEKHSSGENSEYQKQKLTNPVPLDGDGNSVETVRGKHTDVHYIYVCIKG